jgi:hypothetical protein
VVILQGIMNNIKENLSKLPIFSELEDNGINRLVSSIRSQL